ncbi:MAG: GntR family transcriptional regulator [Acetobacteraceae bacterium]
MTSRNRPIRAKPAGREHIGKGGSVDFAYFELRRDIVSLALAPSAVLDEAALVTRLGVSRTPVREALVRLAAEGLVELLPNRGGRVAPMAWDDIRENLEALDVAQRLVTRWAALRRTGADLEAIEVERLEFERLYAARESGAMIDCNWRFHAAVATACRNMPLKQFYLRVLTGNLRISRLAMSYACFPNEAAWRSHVDAIVSEHAAILDSIRRGDADGAEALGRSHTDLARRRVRETLASPLPEAMALSLGADPVG